MTIQLPQSIEQAYLAAAQREGVSLDALVTGVLVSNAPVQRVPTMQPDYGLEMVEEQGVLVLRSGQHLDPAVVDETLEALRLERERIAHF